MPTKKPFITVELEQKKYRDFKELYDTNKDSIYDGVIEIFKELKNSRKRSLTLLVTSKFGPLNWDTEFIFNKKEYDVLMTQILPYFEEIEDYEKCVEIKSLHDFYSEKL
jgi:hypothetical protein